MNVEGNGVPYGTFVERVEYTFQKVILNNDINISVNDELTFTMPRNRFYSSYFDEFSEQFPVRRQHYSMLKVLFNEDPGGIKRYKTLNYEGDQARVTGDNTNEWELHDGLGTTMSFNKYIDNWDKEGWYVENIITDSQEGTLKEFLNKENKWYNHIRGHGKNATGDEFDTSEFSAQGLGFGTLQLIGGS